MEVKEIENDIEIMVSKADSFPDGVMPAFQRLEAALPDFMSRIFYGISHSDGNGIVYYAGIEMKNQEEARNLGFETFTIRKGRYFLKEIKNIRSRIPEMGAWFAETIKMDEVDHISGYCLEIYGENDTVECLVTLA